MAAAAAGTNNVIVCDNGTGVRFRGTGAGRRRGQPYAAQPLYLRSPAARALAAALPARSGNGHGVCGSLHRVTDALARARMQFVKAGYAGDNFPKHIFPSMIGRPMLRAEEEAVGDVALKDIMVGQEASDYRNLLQVGPCFRSRACRLPASAAWLTGGPRSDRVSRGERYRAELGGHGAPVELHLPRQDGDPGRGSSSRPRRLWRAPPSACGCGC